MAHTDSPIKFAIIYGLGEGRWHGSRLIRAFVSYGYEESSLDDADIIIVHSAGLQLLPDDVLGKVIFLNAISLSDGFGHLIWSFHRKLFYDIRHVFTHAHVRDFFVKSCWNIWYLCKYADRLPFLYRSTLATGLEVPDLHARHVYVMAYQNDPWGQNVTPNERDTFLSYAGTHDQLWYTPEMCAHQVQLLYARVLAKTDQV